MRKKSKLQNDSSQTQPSQSTSQSQQRTIADEDELVRNCVRYWLYKADGGTAIRKSDLQKQVLKNVGRSYSTIFNKAKQVLNEVYGFDVYECDDGQSSVRYLISNILPYKHSQKLNISYQHSLDGEEFDIPEDVHKILVMLILTHIFMSNNGVTQNSLFSYLELLQLDPEIPHQIFGNIKTFISNTMVNLKYLVVETDEVSRQVTYKWGPRAEREISKHELLKFVCKIYKDRIPKSWTNQFEIANAQFNNSVQEEQNQLEAMEVVED